MLKDVRLTALSTARFCNEGIFSRCLEMKYMQLHMCYTCLAEFVHHKYREFSNKGAGRVGKEMAE